ncbi:MAG: peptide chain release factor N(5)-glutamine methyltransferase [Bacteroidota bacterium]
MTTTTTSAWTPLSIISWGVDYLRGREIDSPRLTVELLLSHTLQCRRIDLYTNFEKPLTSQELARFKELLKRRLDHEPLQYILGKTEFMGLEFLITPSVFIPRPETERLVEAVLEECKQCVDCESSLNVLDIGTGSGNIPISLAHYDSRIKCVASDISGDALAVAQQNALKHQVAGKILFVKQDILQLFPEKYTPFDIVVSNPPYIALEEYKYLQPEITRYEPRRAATDEKDGLVFFKRITSLMPKLLKAQGKCFIEIAYNQGEEVASLFSSIFQDVSIIKDYSGNDRVVCGRGVGQNG